MPWNVVQLATFWQRIKKTQNWAILGRNISWFSEFLIHYGTIVGWWFSAGHNRPFFSELFSFYSAKTLLHWQHLDKYYTTLEQCNSALPRFPRPPGSLGSKTWPRICHLPKDCWRQKTEKQSKATRKQVGIIKVNTWKSQAPTTRIRFCLKSEIFSSGLAYRPHAFGETVTKNASFQKRSPEWRFLKTLATRLRVDGWKRGFSNTMMLYILLA